LVGDIVSFNWKMMQKSPRKKLCRSLAMDGYVTRRLSKLSLADQFTQRTAPKVAINHLYSPQWLP